MVRRGFGFFFQWSAQRVWEGFRIFFFNGSPNGLRGRVGFFNGSPNGFGRGFGFFFSMVRPTGGVSEFFQWSAQRVCGVGVGFFNGSPNGPGGIQIFSMVRPTRLEGFRFSMVRPTGPGGVSFFNGPTGPGGVSFFNGSPNGSGGVSGFFFAGFSACFCFA